MTALALAALANGCALPQVQPRVAKDFATGQTQVRSIAVLPIDLSVAAEHPGEARLLDARMVSRIQKGLQDALARRGYRTTLVEPSGAVRDPQRGGYQIVIHPRDLAALRVEIHNTTSAHAPGPGYLEARVATELTRHLGKATGADATLYARGYAYVGSEPGGGETALKVVVGILLVVLIVGLVVALVGSKGKGGGGGKAVGRALGGAGRAAGRAALGVGHVVLRTLPYVAHAAAHTHHRARYRDLPCYTCPPPPPPAPPTPVSIGPEAVDEPMPAPTTGPHEAERAPAPPPALPAPPVAAAPRPEPPPTLALRQGPPPSESTVGVQISLVQNASGRVLWHAGQAFAVRTRGEAEVEALIEHFLQGLPRAAR